MKMAFPEISITKHHLEVSPNLDKNMKIYTPDPIVKGKKQWSTGQNSLTTPKKRKRMVKGAGPLKAEDKKKEAEAGEDRPRLEP